MCFLISYYFFWRMSLIVCAERWCAVDESRYEGGAYLKKVGQKKFNHIYKISYIYDKENINVVNQALCS